MEKAFFKIICLGVIVGTLCAPGNANPFDTPMLRAADALLANQQANGGWSEVRFTGETISGLVHVAEITSEGRYVEAAENAGDFVLGIRGYDSEDRSWTLFPFGAEFHALAGLANISDTPEKWTQALTDAFTMVNSFPKETFIDNLLALNELTGAVYQLARITVAADMIGDANTEFLRSQLMDALADVSNDSNAPTLGLASGLWGLAATGPLDQTALSGNSPDLDGIALSQLPSMLASHQAADGDFFWTFDHNDGTSFTEDNSLATLALATSQAMDSGTFGFETEIDAARSVLAGGVTNDGSVYINVDVPESGRFSYLAGETIEAIGVPVLVADVNDDGSVNNLDISSFIRALGISGSVTDPRNRSTFDLLVPGGRLFSADTDRDGIVSNLDITPFIEELRAATVTGSSVFFVPEPATSGILGGAVSALMALRRS